MTRWVKRTMLDDETEAETVVVVSEHGTLTIDKGDAERLLTEAGYVPEVAQ